MSSPMSEENGKSGHALDRPLLKSVAVAKYVLPNLAVSHILLRTKMNAAKPALRGVVLGKSPHSTAAHSRDLKD